VSVEVDTAILRETARMWRVYGVGVTSRAIVEAADEIDRLRAAVVAFSRHYEAHPIVVEAADLIERMAAIKKSVDGAYEHVVELYHAQRQEVEDAEQGRASLPDLVALWDAVHDDEPVVYGTGGMDLTIRKILRNLTHKETP